MTDTNGIEYTTWDEQKPSHPPVSKAVRVAAEHAKITQQVYDEYWYYVRNHAWCDINWPVMESLANRANMANNDLLEARHAALNPCKHENTSMVGSMWFSDGEVDDNIETVCEDCGASLEGGE